jgi:hypothetical protein
MVENYDHPTAPQVRAALDTAHHIESAVASGNSAEYDKAMTEVNQYRNTHYSQGASMYMSAIKQKLEDDHTLPQVALFDAKAHFNDIDKNGDGKLSGGEVAKYRGREGANDLQQALAQNFAEKFDDLKRKESFWGLSDDITHSRLEKGLNNANDTSAIAHLFEKNDSGISLYDRLKDKNGNIPHGALSHFQDENQKNSNTLALTEQDKKTIDYLRSFSGRSMKSYVPFTDDQTRAHLQELCAKHELNLPN